MLRLPAEHVSRLRDSFANRRVTVTGGAGFIGGHLVDCLLGLGAQVTVIDDLSNATPAHLGEAMDLQPDLLTFIQGSILDDDALGQAVEGADSIVHLAALGSVQRSIENPQRSWSVNATGTLRVLEHARKQAVGRVVLAGSSSAYGDTPTLPKVETMLPSPRSPYAVSKLAAEHLCAAWSHSYALDTVTLRFFNVFGPRQPADSAYAAVIPAFVSRLLQGQSPVIYGDGSQSRDFTYIANVVYAVLLACAAPKPLQGATLNIGGGERTDLKQLAQLLAAACDRPHLAPEHREARTGDVRHSLADTARAQDLLGYEPFVSVAEGLAQTVEWMKQNMIAPDLGSR